MVENQQIPKQSVGDKLKSALGVGKHHMESATVLPATGIASGVATATTGVVTGVATQTTVTEATVPVVTQAKVPVVTQTQVPIVAETQARVVTDAPVVKTIAHAPVVAEVHKASSVTVEERPVITQNITKPVIELHEKHVQRNIATAPVVQQAVNPTLVQEIGRENLNFVAPLQTYQTATIEKPAVVTNLKAAPVVAEVRHKPVIERHEQVIIHENVNQSLTEVRTQPIVQNIYEKPVIVKSQETIIETAPTMVAAPTVVAAPVMTAPVMATASTFQTTGLVSTGIARRGSASSLSSPEDVGGVPREGLGSKIKRKLHLGHGSSTTTTTATGLTDPFNFDPDRKIVVQQPVASTMPLASGVALPATGVATTGIATTGIATTTALPTTGLGTTLPEKKGGLFHRH